MTDSRLSTDQLAARIRSTIVAQLDVNGLSRRLAAGCMEALGSPAQAELDRQRAHLAEVEQAQDERARQLGAEEADLDWLFLEIRRQHDREHPSGWAVCDNLLCRRVVDRYE